MNGHFAALHESGSGTFRPFSNVRHSVVVGGKPDIETKMERMTQLGNHCAAAIFRLFDHLVGERQQRRE
jgi:hypothetical protein